jgi:hypothetical protein
MRRTLAGCLITLLTVSGPAFAAQSSGTKEETKQAGSSAKDAGKAAADAGKHAGKAAADATKKTGKAAKKAVTGDAHATCVDGTVQAGKTEEAAAAGCVSHGGVAAKH